MLVKENKLIYEAYFTNDLDNEQWKYFDERQHRCIMF